MAKIQKENSAHKTVDPDSQQEFAKHETSLLGKFTSRLNYLCVEHWLTSAIFILALGFIGFAIQSYFVAVTPARWGVFGILIVVAYIILAAIHVMVKRSKSSSGFVDGGLPGVSLHIYLRLHNISEERRKYLMDFGHIKKERLSLYVSQDNIFTFSFVDAKGEPHPLQIPYGRDGFPVSRFVYLCCELGISGTTTELRMFLEGGKIRSLILPFKTDIGALDIPNGVIGADLAGSNGAAFDLSILFVYSSMLTQDDLRKINESMLTRERESFVEFNGYQWMRIADAPPGSRDLKQPDISKAPKFRIQKH